MAPSQSMLLLVCLAASFIAVYSDEPSDVVVLTPDNFDDYVGKEEGAFVEFYAPWCGHCKKLAPDYEKFGTAFKKTKSVVIAKVDCDAHKDLCSKHGVKGYPSLKWFPSGASKPEDYQGGRSLEDLVSFVNEKMGTSVKIAAAISDVVTLTPSNFDEVVLDDGKDVLVEFYAPWCGHCKSLAPVYETLGTAFKSEKNVVIAKVDADAHKSLGERFGVSGFPTLKWFPKGNKAGEDYNSGRDLSSFVDFINKNSGTARTTAGGLNSKAGRIEVMDEISAKFLLASPAERETLQKSAEEEEKKIAPEKAKEAGFYLKAMRNIISKGNDYAEKEVARLERVLAGSVKAEKADDFTLRKNILSSFLADGGVADE